MKIRDVMTDESQWVKGSFARDASGQSVDIRDETAVCRCFWGWFLFCHGRTAERFVLEAEIDEVIGEEWPKWNDDPSRTFAEVRALVERLDI